MGGSARTAFVRRKPAVIAPAKSIEKENRGMQDLFMEFGGAENWVRPWQGIPGGSKGSFRAVCL
jgi:hypothetical protein